MKPVMQLAIGDRFYFEDPLSDEVEVLTVRSGPVNCFGSVMVEVEEWDFDFEATHLCTVRLVKD